MELHNVNLLPRDVGFYGDLEDLSEYDNERIAALGVDEAWYWYVNGGYDGSGQLIMRKGNLYALHDMGHCSCYGPTDQIDPLEFKTLEEIKANCSAELLNLIADLIAAIEKS